MKTDGVLKSAVASLAWYKSTGVGQVGLVETVNAPPKVNLKADVKDASIMYAL